MKKVFRKFKGNVFQKRSALETNFRMLTEECIPEQHVLLYAEELLSMPSRYGDRNLLLWALDDPYNMPHDAQYDYVWYSSFLALATLTYAGMLFPSVQKIPNYWETLGQGLTDCLGADGHAGQTFFGHGYEAIDFFLDCMYMFADSCMPLFLEVNPAASPMFAKAFQEAVNYLETRICSGQERNEWSGRPYMERANVILEKLNNRNIFVYGTLMSGRHLS